MGFFHYAVLGIGITIIILLSAIAYGLEGILNRILSQLDLPQHLNQYMGQNI